MRFNWDNPHIIIAQWPWFTGGQFLANCLSLSSKIMPIMPAEQIRKVLDIQDKKEANSLKIKLLMEMLPKTNKSAGKEWHNPKVGLLSSNNWLTNDLHKLSDIDLGLSVGTRFSEMQWRQAQHASREYFDQFWRDPAVAVSHSNYGLVIKTHHPRDTDGLKHLFPQAKIMSVCNYSKWQSYCQGFKNGPNGEWAEDQSLLMDGYSVDSSAFLFDVDDLIADQESYSEQMGRAYDFFGIDHKFHVLQELFEYRTRYIMSNTKFNS